MGSGKSHGSFVDGGYQGGESALAENRGVSQERAADSRLAGAMRLATVRRYRFGTKVRQCGLIVAEEDLNASFEVYHVPLCFPA